MRPTDWPAVKAIYEQGIATRQATFETEAPSWEDWDADHLADLRLVAERDGEIVAWAALSPTSRRGAMPASSRRASTSPRECAGRRRHRAPV